MNRWEVQQNAMMVGCEELRAPAGVSYSDRKRPVPVCPKPRRIHFLASNLTMSLRWQRSSQQADVCDSKAGTELLDMILRKEGHGEGRSCSAREIASSPPFFCGSPPSRVSNPIVQDAQFGEGNSSPLSTLQLASPSASASLSPSPSAVKPRGVRRKYGLKSPTVRVEGFDCLGRDRQNSGITAMA